MQNAGARLVAELKAHVIQAMQGMPECDPRGPGVTYRAVQDLAGLGLNLPAQDGWLTWSILASLKQEGKVETVPRGTQRLYWRLTSVV